MWSCGDAVRRAALAVAAAAAAVLLSAAPAAAHAELVGSDPPAGAVLATAPAEVRLSFDEDISPGVRSARLVDGSGGQVRGTRLLSQDDPRRLVLRVPALADGTYGMVWQVLA